MISPREARPRPPGRRPGLAVLPSCGPDQHDLDDVRIGALYPYSGQQGPGGTEEARGAELAVEAANERRVLPGRRLRLVARDVPDAAGTPAAMADLDEDGVELVVGSYGSTISAAAAAEARERGMLLWETGAVGQVAAEAGPGETFFRAAPMGANLGRAAIGFVRDQLAGRLGTERPLRYAVAHVNDAYGRAVAAGAVDELEASGQPLVANLAYDPWHLDTDGLMATLAEAAPDVLFVAAYLDDGIALRRATVESRLPLLASIGTSSSYCMPEFAAALGPAAVGLFASDKPAADVVRPEALRPEARELLTWARDRYRSRFGAAMSPAALSGFASTWALVAKVLPAAASTGSRDVAAAALATKLPTGSLANGAGLDFAPPGRADAGENLAATSVIWQWVDPATQVVVWPPAFATAPLRAIALQR